MTHIEYPSRATRHQITIVGMRVTSLRSGSDLSAILEPRSHSPSVTKVAKNGGHGRLLALRLRRGDKLEPKVPSSKVVVFWRAAVERLAKGKHPLFDNALDNTPNKISAVDVLHRSHRGVRMAYWTVLL